MNKTKNQKISFKNLPMTYEGLMKVHLVRPIHDRVDLQNATEIVEALAGFSLNADQEEYLEALSLMVEAYESESFIFPENEIKGLEALKQLLKEHSMNASDLAQLLDVDRSLGVRILSGERRLTVDHIKILSKRFHIAADVFMK